MKFNKIFIGKQQIKFYKAEIGKFNSKDSGFRLLGNN
jgi:hypothetical protein